MTAVCSFLYQKWFSFHPRWGGTMTLRQWLNRFITEATLNWRVYTTLYTTALRTGSQVCILCTEDIYPDQDVNHSYLGLLYVKKNVTECVCKLLLTIRNYTIDIESETRYFPWSDRYRETKPDSFYYYFKILNSPWTRTITCLIFRVSTWNIKLQQAWKSKRGRNWV